ncbi:MAG: sulfotransferase, partial [Pseudomonadota bacterium]
LLMVRPAVALTLTHNGRTTLDLVAEQDDADALHRRLAALTGGTAAVATPHFMGETLYWTKSASILDLPQTQLPHSEVPIPAKRARSDLARFLAANSVGLKVDLTEKKTLFSSWTDLITRNGPLFIEKSPHHLYQPQVVALMREYAAAQNDVGVLFVGIVRNPMDTLYSSWRRFGVDPAKEEAHWLRAYKTWRRLEKDEPGRSVLLRYEDIVSGRANLGPIFAFAGASNGEPDGATSFHSRSVGRWKDDRGFGFALSRSTIEFAQEFGYQEAELTNRNAGSWFLRRAPREVAFRIINGAQRALRGGVWRLRQSLRH